MATRHATDDGATSSARGAVWRDRLRHQWPIIRFAGLFVGAGIAVYLVLTVAQGTVASLFETQVTSLSRKALDALLRLGRSLGLPRPEVDTKLEFPLRELAVFVVAVVAVRVPIGEQLRGLVFGALVVFVTHLGGVLILPAAAPWLAGAHAWAPVPIWEAVVLSVVACAWLRWYVQLDPVAQG